MFLANVVKKVSPDTRPRVCFVNDKQKNVCAMIGGYYVPSSVHARKRTQCKYASAAGKNRVGGEAVPQTRSGDGRRRAETLERRIVCVSAHFEQNKTGDDMWCENENDKGRITHKIKNADLVS